MGENTVDYWISLADYDLKVADSLLEKEHYIYVGFMCHQAIEKMLKAIYVNKINSTPPYIHKLDKLIELSGIKKEFNDEQYDIIDELTPLNIQARYPAYKEAIYKLLTKEKAQTILLNTGDLITWLKTLIL